VALRADDRAESLPETRHHAQRNAPSQKYGRPPSHHDRSPAPRPTPRGCGGRQSDLDAHARRCEPAPLDKTIHGRREALRGRMASRGPMRSTRGEHRHVRHPRRRSTAENSQRKHQPSRPRPKPCDHPASKQRAQQHPGDIRRRAAENARAGPAKMTESEKPRAGALRRAEGRH